MTNGVNHSLPAFHAVRGKNERPAAKDAGAHAGFGEVLRSAKIDRHPPEKNPVAPIEHDDTRWTKLTARFGAVTEVAPQAGQVSAADAEAEFTCLPPADARAPAIAAESTAKGTPFPETFKAKADADEPSAPAPVFPKSDKHDAEPEAAHRHPVVTGSGTPERVSQSQKMRVSAEPAAPAPAADAGKPDRPSVPNSNPQAESARSLPPGTAPAIKSRDALPAGQPDAPDESLDAAAAEKVETPRHSISADWSRPAVKAGTAAQAPVTKTDFVPLARTVETPQRAELRHQRQTQSSSEDGPKPAASFAAGMRPKPAFESIAQSNEHRPSAAATGKEPSPLATEAPDAHMPDFPAEDVSSSTMSAVDPLKQTVAPAGSKPDEPEFQPIAHSIEQAAPAADGKSDEPIFRPATHRTEPAASANKAMSISTARLPDHDDQSVPQREGMSLSAKGATAVPLADSKPGKPVFPPIAHSAQQLADAEALKPSTEAPDDAHAAAPLGDEVSPSVNEAVDTPEESVPSAGGRPDMPVPPSIKNSAEHRANAVESGKVPRPPEAPDNAYMTVPTGDEVSPLVTDTADGPQHTVLPAEGKPAEHASTSATRSIGQDAVAILPKPAPPPADGKPEVSALRPEAGPNPRRADGPPGKPVDHGHQPAPIAIEKVAPQTADMPNIPAGMAAQGAGPVRSDHKPAAAAIQSEAITTPDDNAPEAESPPPQITAIVGPQHEKPEQPRPAAAGKPPVPMEEKAVQPERHSERGTEKADSRGRPKSSEPAERLSPDTARTDNASGIVVPQLIAQRTEPVQRKAAGDDGADSRTAMAGAAMTACSGPGKPAETAKAPEHGRSESPEPAPQRKEPAAPPTEAASARPATTPTVRDGQLPQAPEMPREADARHEAAPDAQHPVTIVSERSIPAPASPAPSANALALVTAIASNSTPQATAAVAILQHPAHHANSGATQELKIQLHPAELGIVTASLRFSGGQLEIELKVENREAYDRMSADKDTIVKSLRGLGLDVDKVTVMQPAIASSTQNRADATLAMPAPASRDQAPPQPGNSGAGGERTGGQQPGRGGNDGGQDRPKAGQGPQDGPGGALYI